MEDSQIVELYWQRQSAAILETAAKYGAYCRTVAYNILSNTEDAEECVNDTYMSAWNAMPDKRPERLAPFLGKITRNHALSRMRGRARQKRGGGELALALEELDECIPSPADVEREVEHRELAAAVGAFIDGLPDPDRQVFVSRYWYLAPVDEIAEKFGFSRNKTASMLFRCRNKLQKFLQQEGLC